jgi:hypothetical protein
MRYLLAIYAVEDAWAALPAAQREAAYAEYAGWVAEASGRGMMLDGAELEPTSAATSVRVRDGRTLIVDGPFAETKEQLGGYFLLECETLDDAIEAAGRIPAARTGTVEVRPLVER